MAKSSDVKLVIDFAKVPVFPGVLDLISTGIVTGGGMRNLDQLGQRIHDFSGRNSEETLALSFDPQTSGGLLIAISERDAEKLCAAIQATNGECWQIGYISGEEIESGSGSVEIR